MKLFRVRMSGWPPKATDCPRKEEKKKDNKKAESVAEKENECPRVVWW
jgi:hypothetical protein